MCLIISKVYHKKDKSNRIKHLVAQEDILVYKCLDCEDGEYCTPFQFKPIIFTKGKYAYNKVNMPKSKYYWNDTIKVGIHTYTIKKRAIKVSESFNYLNGISMHYAVIPKGSNFYIGRDDDIVSNNLIVYREKRCFDKHYPNIIDVTEYILKYLKAK